MPEKSFNEVEIIGRELLVVYHQFTAYSAIEAKEQNTDHDVELTAADELLRVHARTQKQPSKQLWGQMLAQGLGLLEQCGLEPLRVLVLVWVQGQGQVLGRVLESRLGLSLEPELGLLLALGFLSL